MIRQLRIALFLSVVLGVHVFAGIQFSVAPEQNSGAVGDQITVTASIVSTENLKGMAAPQIPKSDYFNLVRTSQNQSQSSSIQIVNGRMSQTVEITYQIYYVIALTKEGACTFPALTFVYNGTNYASEPFPLTIGKEPSKAPGGGDLSLQLHLNKSKIYVGEQGIMTFDVLKKPQASIDLTSEGFSSAINALEGALGKNFSITRLFRDKVGQSQRTVNGEIRQVFTLQFTIIPLNPGTHTIQQFGFNYVELRRVQTRDPFGDFFGGNFFGGGVQQVEKTAYSSPFTVTVSPLPPQPSGFSGAVGSFTLKASVNLNTVPSGEAVTLAIIHSGTTRPGNMPDLALPPMPDFEFFTPEKHIDVDTTPTGIRTTKKYNFLVIPRQEGERMIPAIQWTYFDPASATYKTLSTLQIPITVTKGTKEAKQQTRYLTQEDIREVGQDIRYIKTQGDIKNQASDAYRDPIFLVLFPVPFCIMLFSLLYRLQAIFLKKDQRVVRRKKAYITAEKKVNALKHAFNTAVSPHAVSEIAAIIEFYITDSFGFAAAGKTWDQLKEELQTMKVHQSVIDTLIPLMERLDTFRFGGLSADKKALFEMLDQTLVIIEDLEKREKN